MCLTAFRDLEPGPILPLVGQIDVGRVFEDEYIVGVV